MRVGVPAAFSSDTKYGLRHPAAASHPLASRWPRPQQQLPVSATGGGHCCCRPFHRPPYCLRQQGPTPADGPQRNYRPTGQSSSSFWKQDGGEFSEQIPAKWGPGAKRWVKDFPRPGEDGSARKGSTGGSGLICEEKLPAGLPILYNNRFAILPTAWYNNKIK